MPDSFRVEGADELRRALRAVEGGTSDLKDVHARAARLVADRATQLAPRLSGRLASSVRSTGQARVGVVRAGFASIPYAGPIHFGWRAHNIEPQPFLYDALDDRRAAVFEAYRRQVDDLIARHNLA